MTATPHLSGSPPAPRQPAALATLSPAPTMNVVRPDINLLEQFRDGDPAAFAELLHQHQSAIHGYLYRCGLSEAQRDDLFQEIFIKVSRAASTFLPERPFKPWLFKIAVNTVRSHFRRRHVEAAEFQDRQAASPEPSGEAMVAARETARWLQDAIVRLPPAQREVVNLVCGERLPQAQVAQLLEMPLGTVKTLLRRARLTLARQLAARNARTARESHLESP